MIALASIITTESSFAGPRVVGNLNSMNIEAQNCSVEEILNSLADKFNFHYRSTADLSSQITGIYEGSLLRILPRLLTGFSYFVKSETGRLDLTVLGTEKDQARSESEGLRNQDGDLDGSGRFDSGRLDAAAPGAQKPQGSVRPEATGDPDNHRGNASEPEFGG